MTRRIVRYCAVALLLAIPVCSYGQNTDNTNPKKDKKSVVKINKMDVIYQDEEYTGIVIDHKDNPQNKDTEKQIYHQPFIIAPPPAEDVVDPMPNIYQMVDDEGAESEDDILYASFDSVAIHYPKLNLATWKPGDTVEIQLVNPRRRQNFSYPTPSISKATSHFGPRRRRFHYGVDLAMATGENIYAAFDGVIRISKFNSSYGNLVVIRHFNGLETYYAHMSKLIARVGDTVRAGDVIGLCGNTGRSRGSHLHFEIRYMGNAMNPEHVIDCTKQTLISNTLKLTPASFRKVASYTGGNSSASGSRPAAQYYKVRSGDTLSKIAKRNGTTVKKLCQLNGLRETSVLSVGRRLRIR